MFLNYDNGNNKIRQMTTDTTANCVEAEKENERASTLSNNLNLNNQSRKIFFCQDQQTKTVLTFSTVPEVLFKFCNLRF